MASIWMESVGRSLEQALDLLAAAIQDCTDELWEEPMWRVAAPPPGHQFLGTDWAPISEPDQVAAAAQTWVNRRSTPWSVAWHALECFDYDLNGELGSWSPPPPFAGHPHWRDLTNLSAAWSRAALLGYVDHCRRQQRDVLATMTGEKATALLPPAHRYGGQPHARIVTSLIGHTTEHATQIQQFTSASSAHG